MSRKILVPISEPVESMQPACGGLYDPENDVPEHRPQLVQVFEEEVTENVMGGIIRRYAFKGIERV
jgi:hypothetical protein